MSEQDEYGEPDSVGGDMLADDAGIVAGRSVFGDDPAEPDWIEPDATESTQTTAPEPRLQEADPQELGVWTDHTAAPQWDEPEDALPPIEPARAGGVRRRRRGLLRLRGSVLRGHRHRPGPCRRGRSRHADGCAGRRRAVGRDPGGHAGRPGVGAGRGHRRARPCGGRTAQRGAGRRIPARPWCWAWPGWSRCRSRPTGAAWRRSLS